MDRSRRDARGRAPTADPAASAPPPSSRLTLRARKNRRRPASVWSRVPRPRAIADACGRALRRSLPALIAAGAVLGTGTGLWLGYRFLTTSSRYAITSIEIRGTERLSPDDIRAALPVRVGDNVFSASAADLEHALRAQPWIASASVDRILPGSIVIELRERVPVAAVVLGDTYLVDAAGHAFARAPEEAADTLPTLTGLDRARYTRDPDAGARTITAALDVLARWRSDASRPAIDELHLGSHDQLALYTRDHATAIELGELASLDDDAVLTARLRTFDAAWAELTAAEREAARAFHLDARPDHVTVAFAKD